MKHFKAAVKVKTNQSSKLDWMLIFQIVVFHSSQNRFKLARRNESGWTVFTNHKFKILLADATAANLGPLIMVT